MKKSLFSIFGTLIALINICWGHSADPSAYLNKYMIYGKEALYFQGNNKIGDNSCTGDWGRVGSDKIIGSQDFGGTPAVPTGEHYVYGSVSICSKVVTSGTLNTIGSVRFVDAGWSGGAVTFKDSVYYQKDTLNGSFVNYNKGASKISITAPDLPVSSPTIGSQNCTQSAGQNQWNCGGTMYDTLPAGSYKNLVCQAGVGKVCKLGSGLYQVDSLNAIDQEIQFAKAAGSITRLVLRTLENTTSGFGTKSRFVNSVGTDFGSTLIYISASDTIPIGDQSYIMATLLAPNAVIKLETGVTLAGQVIAKQVWLMDGFNANQVGAFKAFIGSSSNFSPTLTVNNRWNISEDSTIVDPEYLFTRTLTTANLKATDGEQDSTQIKFILSGNNPDDGEFWVDDNLNGTLDVGDSLGASKTRKYFTMADLLLNKVKYSHLNKFTDDTLSFRLTDGIDTSAVTHMGITLNVYNDSPTRDSLIRDQSITSAQTFTNIQLNKYVSDEETLDTNMVWTVENVDTLNISISSGHVASISVKNPLWTGKDTVVFVATDTGSAGKPAKSIRDTVVFSYKLLVGTPDSTTFKTVVTDTSIKAIWGKVNNAIKYVAFLKDSTGSVISTDTVSLPLNNPDTSFTWTKPKVQSNTKYSWTVIAISATDTSSTPLDKKTKTLVSLPGSLSSTTTAHSVTANWTAVTNATKYQVTFFDSTGTQIGSATDVTAPTLTKTWTGLNSLTKYQWTIKTFVGTDTSVTSAKQQATTLAGVSTPDSTTFKTVVTDTSIKAIWGKVNSAIKYVAFLKDSTGSVISTDTVSLPLNNPDTSFTWTKPKVQSNTKYSWTVIAISATDTSSTPLDKKTKTLVSLPGSLSSTTTAHSVTANWTAVTNATKYQVTFFDSTGTQIGSATDVTAPTLTKTWTGLNSLTKYQWTIKTFVGTDTSVTSAKQQATTLAGVSTPDSTTFKTVVTDTSIKAIWGKVNNAIKYVAFLKDSTGSVISTDTVSLPLNNPDTSFTWTKPKVQSNTKYSWTVIAISATDTSSTPLDKKTKTLVSLPGSLLSTTTAHSVTAHWTAVTNATKYQVTFFDSTGTQIGSATDVTAPTLTKTWTGLNSLTKYQWTIKTFVGTDTSVTSAKQQATTLAGVSTPDSTTFKTVVTDTSIKAIWGKVNNAIKYVAFLKDSTGSVISTDTVSLPLNNPDTTFTWTKPKVQSNTKYSWTVVAISATDTSSTPLDKKTKTLVSLPGSLSSTTTAHSVTAHWTAVTNATKYQVTFFDSTGTQIGSATDVTAPTLTKTWTGLNSLTKYQWTIKTFVGTDTSVTSAKQQATTLAGVSTPDSTTFKTVVTDTSIKAIWNKVANATQYLAILKDSNGVTLDTNVVIQPDTTTTWTSPLVKSNTKYSWTVIAIGLNDTSSTPLDEKTKTLETNPTKIGDLGTTLTKVEDFKDTLKTDLKTVFKDASTYEVVVKQQKVEVSVVGSELVISAKKDAFGKDTIIVTAKNSNGQVSDTLFVDITPENDDPVLVTQTIKVPVNKIVGQSIGSVVTLDVDNDKVTIRQLNYTPDFVLRGDSLYLKQAFNKADSAFDVKFEITDGTVKKIQTLHIVVQGSGPLVKTLSQGQFSQEFIVRAGVVHFTSSQTEVTLFNLQGKEVRKANQGANTLELNGLQSGVYIIRKENSSVRILWRE